jgi:cell division septation protein DedD
MRGRAITNSEEQEFWFNTKTMQVEVGKQVLALYRIGPFSSRAEAEHALETLRTRSEQWSKEDQED